MTEDVSPVLDGGKDVITQCACKIEGNNFSVTLTNTELRWHIADSTEQKGIQAVRIVDILSVSLKSSSKQENNNDSVCVSYVQQEKKFILKLCCAVFTSGDSQININLHQHITDLVRDVGHRPKKLLVLINPTSGKKKGRPVYEEKVVPIFQDAGIDTDVIVTERAHHAEEILSTYDIKSIDGLIAVGGDGIYHEAVNGLMRRLATEQGLNVDDPDETLPEIDLPVGVIPCGTGNGMAYGCYGNKDVTTAALSIAIGYQSPANMMPVHSGHKLICYSILFAGYGLWSDLIKATESTRNQGMWRQTFAIAQHLFIKPQRRIQLTIQHINEETADQQDDSEVTTQTADLNPNTTIADDIKGTSDTAEQFHASSNKSLKSATTKVSVTASIISMVSASAGSSERPDLSQAMMFLNKPAGRMKYVTFLYNLWTLNNDAINAREDIIIFPGKEWTVKLEEPSQPDTENWELEHILNVDGEKYILPTPEYRAKLLCGGIKLFSNMPYVTERVMK